jgi:LysM repeat protein
MDPRQEPYSNPPSALTPGKICPFLGKFSDPDTCYSYPDFNNRCHHAKPPQPILLDYQANVCLAGKYQDCPVYPQGWKEPFPVEISGDQPRARRSWTFWFVIALVVLVLITLLYFIFFRQSGQSTPADETPTQEAALVQDPTSSPQLQQGAPTFTLTATVLPPTNTPTIPPPTATSTRVNTLTATTSPTPDQPTPGPLEETPFGPGGHYLVHIVKEGDSLENIAKLYNTTIEVLKAINMTPPQTSLWVGVPTVIIVGEKDLTKVSPLKAVWLAERALVLDLRQKYQMTEEEFRNFNALGSGNWVEAGRWLIVKR